MLNVPFWEQTLAALRVLFLWNTVLGGVLSPEWGYVFGLNPVPPPGGN